MFHEPVALQHLVQVHGNTDVKIEMMMHCVIIEGWAEPASYSITSSMLTLSGTVAEP